MRKLSIVAILVAGMATSAVAKGDVTFTSYFYTDDTGANDLFGDSSQLGLAAKLNYSKELAYGLKLNLEAMGVANFIDDSNFGYFDSPDHVSGILNVANVEGEFAGTTFIVGRQLLDTPLVGGFDWLMAPGSFGAFTAINKSISNLTLVGSYLYQYRPNNSGSNWIKLRDDNWAVGGIYGIGDLALSAWYYNVDHAGFKAAYADATYKIAGFDVGVQGVSTDYDVQPDSVAVAGKLGATYAGFGVEAAVSMTKDNAAGYVGRDVLYTSSWNYFASNAAVVNDDTLSWKVGANGSIAGADATLSYAQYGDEGREIDVILGYNLNDNTTVGAVYTNTDYDVNVDNIEAINAVELFVNFKI